MFDFVTLGSATKDIFLFLDKSSLKPGVNRHFLDIPTDKKIDVNRVLEFTDCGVHVGALVEPEHPRGIVVTCESCAVEVTEEPLHA